MPALPPAEGPPEWLVTGELQANEPAIASDMSNSCRILPREVTVVEDIERDAICNCDMAAA